MFRLHFHFAGNKIEFGRVNRRLRAAECYKMQTEIKDAHLRLLTSKVYILL